MPTPSSAQTRALIRLASTPAGDDLFHYSRPTRDALVRNGLASKDGNVLHLTPAGFAALELTGDGLWWLHGLLTDVNA